MKLVTRALPSLLAFVLCGALSACVSPRRRLDISSLTPWGTRAANKVSLLTFNVENLFDLKDDPEKNDETFLPLALKNASPALQNKCRVQNDSSYRQSECLEYDWSRAAYNRKLSRITDVVAQVNEGWGPDILILQEVENREVLEDWRKIHLSRMGYHTISHAEGPDERGIDVAVISRLPLVKGPVLHPVDFSNVHGIDPKTIRPTRGILETHLQLPGGDRLAVFAVHFPSQGAPTELRKVAVETLLNVTRQMPPGTHVVTGGDFNITAREEWTQKYFRDLISRHFEVSHLVGCAKCAGTTYYKDNNSWSFFDVLLFSKDLAPGSGGWEVDRNSIRVVNSSVYQMSRFGTPARFDGGRGPVGVSDHWPMYAEIRLHPSREPAKDTQ
ncbi:MAG: endonuclease/exonuclease/phosphatase family protein [Bdellovibrionales bacterium]